MIELWAPVRPQGSCAELSNLSSFGFVVAIVQQMIIGSDGYASDALSSEMFGINALFTKDGTLDGGQYDTFVDQLGTTSFRFPGGTVTEKLFEPDNLTSQRFWSLTDPMDVEDDFVTAKEFVAYAADKGATIDWVLPTENFYTAATDSAGNHLPDQAAIDDLLIHVDDLIHGRYGEVSLDTVTIGNEYWVNNGARETPAEYGKMVNVMAKKLDDLFEDYREEIGDPDWVAPKIAMQTALPWDREDIPQIIGEMDMEARAAIDVIETHYYPDDYAEIHSSDGVFARLDDIAYAEGFGNVEYYVSEWNVQNRVGNEFGMEQASDIIEMMEDMAVRGVDQASVWGTTYKALYTRLGRIYNSEDAPGGTASELTPAGEVMRMMSRSLVDTQVIDVSYPQRFFSEIGDEAAQDQLDINAFGNDEKVVIFLASRSADGIDVELNVGDLVSDYDHLWVQQLSTIDNPFSSTLDEGDPLSHLSRPFTETFMGDEVTASDGDIQLSLDGYDIVKLEFSIGSGVDMWGNDAKVDRYADYTDRLVGTDHADTIAGNLGDDTLMGEAGRDTIFGGEGNDTIDGGAGDDTLVTGEGNDIVTTGEGKDTVITGEGENDVTIEGEGAHLFIDTTGDTVVSGFDASAGHTLSFMGAYETADDVLNAVRVQDDDLVFLHTDGGTTELLGAAGQLDDLTSSLVDFTDPEGVAATLDRVENMRGDTEFADFLSTASPEEVEDYLASLSMSELSDLLETTDVNALLETIPAENLPLLLNAFGQTELDAFFDEADPLTLLDHLEDAGDGADAMMAALDIDVLDDYLLRIADAFPLEESVDLEVDTKSVLEHEYATHADIIPSVDEIIQTMNQTIEEEDETPFSGSDVSDMTLDGGAGSCFVATVAYGDTYHPDVNYLRRVRDEILVHNRFGRVFIWTYWRVGPILAKLLMPHPHLRKIARGVLARMIGQMRDRDVVARYSKGFRSSYHLSGRGKKG
jgi:hypothetical protein